MTKNCVNGGDIRLHYLITLERFEALHDKACWRIRRSCVLENEWDLVWKVRKGCQRGRPAPLSTRSAEGARDGARSRHSRTRPSSPTSALVRARHSGQGIAWVPSLRLVIRRPRQERPQLPLQATALSA